MALSDQTKVKNGIETMDRREILKIAVAAMLNEKLPFKFDRSEPAKTDRKRIIVIGAGLAGLAAARHLQAADQEVLLLEARDRIGGRVWTSLKWPDMPLDLGASWIHGLKGNPLTQLAQETGAKLVETNYERNTIYDTNGEELSEKKEELLDQLRSEIEHALNAVQDDDDDVSIREVMDELQTELNATPETRRQLDFIISSLIEQEFAGSAANMSSHWYDNTKEFDGEDGLFLQGYHQIVNWLAKDLTVKTGQIVKRISWSQTSLRINTDGDEFTADRVLVTLPLGVLQAGHVEFDPPLPKAMTNTISKLGMGVLNKCYLRFSKVFWPVDVDWLEYIPEQHGEWVEWVSFVRTSELPVLVGFNAADRGRQIEALTDQQIVSSAMENLRIMFGKQIPEPTDFQITRWASDPFAMGSYSFNPVGVHPKLRRQLASSVENRLFFAGEATETDYFGTAHGAYLSGIRAAKEMLQSLDKQ